MKYTISNLLLLPWLKRLVITSYSIHYTKLYESNASSHEASCAKTIVSIGADLAFVVAARKKDKEIRVSVRSRKIISKRVHMGSLMEKVAKKLGGQGGGHEEAVITSYSIHYTKLYDWGIIWVQLDGPSVIPQSLVEAL